MFDIGATELLMIVVVAILVIGPKDMPMALRTAGRWIGKMRRLSSHFRSGFDAMVREAEMEEMEKKWRDQNAKIMRHNPPDSLETEPTGAYPAPDSAKSKEPASSGSGTDPAPDPGPASTPPPPSTPQVSAEAKVVPDPVATKEDR